MLISLTFIFSPEFFLSWFKNEEDIQLWEKVSQTVPYILMFMAIFTLFDSINFVFSFALKGAGDTRFVFLASLLLPWPLMVLPTYLMKDYENAVYLAWV